MDTIAAHHILTLLFSIVVVLVYYILPSRFRWIVLLCSSLVFYFLAEPWLILLGLSEAVWTWWVGKKLTQDTKKRWLLAGIIPVVFSLFIFKYLGFFCSSVSKFLSLFGVGFDSTILKLALPLGISYYTFKLLAYQIDIYRNKYQPEQNLGHFLTYALYFPQIVCGPIQRPHDFLTQIQSNATFNATLMDQGVQRILLGLFKITAIANPILTYVNSAYSHYSTISGLTLACAAFLYSILIYADFSGCSDIAIGTSNLFGLTCPQNFNTPYFSHNIREFWKKWHISLTSWLKDYIYISLGGNRCKPFRAKLNILITFLVSGLWHGANWTFIFWGLIHGIWNILTPRPKKEEETNEEQKSKFLKKLKGFISIVLTFLGVTLCWVFFRSESITDAFSYLARMITHFNFSVSSCSEAILLFVGDNTALPICLTLILSIVSYSIFEIKTIHHGGETPYLPNHWMVFFFVLMIMFGKFSESGFLYANF